ncbi:thioredoxin fold domain-containing protein [Sulfuricurvum sp.]|uniref:thioredoxin fold domain-containing protein n=1 Tax=Sulfuricurvum sp. TaxID=2025608 RepID=UPI0026135EB4|nr:thioredoxin fold domain-containing protein [Sulfuricurvum sp.]MDD2266297.1 thioredoxin fold domain-containing protein [Sulfuricurvum sp.]MDD2783345.1 thioredoxin fold domain-containing protein [Sulfuricurvum sp.]
MKKIVISLCALVSVVMADDPIISELSALDIIKESQIQILKVHDEGSVYLIKGLPTRVVEGQEKRPFDFFITKDKKILITGNAIRTDTKQRVSFPMDKNIIAGKEAFSYGTGKEVLYVFIDPQCPYCKQFEKIMPTLKEKYTFKIYLFPLSFHPEAIPMSKWILKGSDQEDMAERLLAIANGSQEYKNVVLSADEDKRLMDLINIQIGLAKEIEVMGTPTVMDSDLNKMNWPSL